ncbi:FAD-binding oxidoreductase [Aquicoccus sp. G2-2]|uniref:FAD-binding oxidoreductase n=1 Tax=Aquicoccus sp. G2-2 TaxID=3092120 RepID=UPI002AE07DBF|nr:FAD-linked oxidase C-terminal domain-containing protein [Aquicoccus sp. G2-2]MEA1113580.1 FAD-linked oxidase C-terminal domain-containing protein [Aquicoccus sp. G2-2]
MTTPHLNDALKQALHSLLGERFSLNPGILREHGRSETYFPLTPPDAVVFPESTGEVSAIMKLCAEAGVPVVGWGTGTSLEGQSLATSGGIVVDFSRMNKVLAVHQADMDVAVQPGVTREALNEDLRATGLFFPVDPGANASLGGMASTRASGTTAVRYGTMRDNVLGLEVVLADGTIIRTGTRARKSSAGYDLTGLFVGAEGTLGLITELTLRLHGQPEAVTAAICAFNSVDDAVRAVIDTIQMGLSMARIELLDVETVKAFNAYAGVQMPESPHLMVEFHGSESGVAEMAETFGAIIADHHGHGFDWATRPEDRNALWTMRHNGAYAIYAARPGWKGLVTDVCVPISRLAEAVNETAADLAQAGLYGPILGHVGDGNFHSVIMFDATDHAMFDKVKAASNRMVERALAMGGTATGEHGIGIGKLSYMPVEHGPAWAVMGAIKQALDPQNRMNPGKMVPPRT